MTLETYIFESEQKYYLFDLVHDEYLESVIAGHDEDYQEWADFAAYIIAKVTIPEQRSDS